MVSHYVKVSSPLWDMWPDITFYPKVAVLSLWGALSDKRSGLLFVGTCLPSRCLPTVISYGCYSYPKASCQNKCQTNLYTKCKNHLLPVLCKISINELNVFLAASSIIMSQQVNRNNNFWGYGLHFIIHALNCTQAYHCTVSGQLCSSRRQNEATMIKWMKELTLWSGHYSRGHQLCSRSIVSQHFMESKGALSHSQEPSTCPCPEPY
jgi:hypothetical protein